jgi:signal transduction histidine kinase/ligand-binding sensor domain-containing protein
LPTRPCPLTLAILTALCSAASLRGQTYAYRSYGADAGVPSANAIAYDAHGTLVVGTNDGLVRFDGFRFEPVPLPGLAEARVLRLTPGPDSSLWIQTAAGALFRLTPDDRVMAVNVPPALATELAAYRSWQRLRVDAGGHVWINGWGPGLWRFDPGTARWSHRDWSRSERVIDFFFEGQDLLWIASKDNVGRLTLRGEEVTGAAWSAASGPTVFIRPHSPGHAWLGTGAGVYLLGPGGSARQVMGREYVAGRHAEPDVDATGRLLATIGITRPHLGPRGGVVRLGTAGEQEFPRGSEPALEAVLARQLLFGEGGDFWLAHEGGLVHLEQEYLVSYPLMAPNGAPEHSKEIAYDSLTRSLWISTWGGMYRLRNERVDRMSLGPRRATSRATPGRDGTVWWREHGDLGFAVHDRAFSARTDRSEHLILESRDGVTFVARPDGFFRKSGDVAVRISSRRFIAAPNAETGDGRIWLAPVSSIFTRLDTVEGDSLGTECRACLPPSVRAVIDSLRSLDILEMEADAYGRVWIAAGRSGLTCVYHTAEGDLKSQQLRVADGLLSDEVHAIAATPDGRLWVGTARGLQEFRLARGSPSLEPLLEFRARDGIAREFVSAVLEDPDGYLWFGTTPGELQRLDYRHIPRLASPAVRIARVEIDGEPRRMDGKELRVRAGRARLAVHLSAQTYRQLERLRVQYRLASSDTSWVDLGGSRSVQIASISPGRHRFEARAVRPGQPPGPIVRQDFLSVPPFYRTWWFGIATVAALALLPMLWYRNRIERQLAMERLRLRIATDLHDDLGSGLTQVSLYSELIRRESEPHVAAWAEQVGEQARSLSEGMRDIIWAIHPQHENWDALESRIKDYAVDLLAPRGIVLDMQGTVESVSATLSTDVRHNLLLLVKEALHNAVRHSGCRRIEIRWRLSTHRLVLGVRDDGRGFDPNAAPTGNGLPNLRRRAAEIRAELRLEGIDGGGTCVAVDVPL